MPPSVFLTASSCQGPFLRTRGAHHGIGARIYSPEDILPEPALSRELPSEDSFHDGAAFRADSGLVQEYMDERGWQKLRR